MYYFYRKSNRGHGFCPLYRGCPPFKESVIRGFTVVLRVAQIYAHCYGECISESTIPHTVYSKLHASVGSIYHRDNNIIIKGG